MTFLFRTMVVLLGTIDVGKFNTAEIDFVADPPSTDRTVKVLADGAW